MEVFLWTVIIVLFVASFVGLVLPVIPGTVLILAGFAIYHFFLNYAVLGWRFWAAMILLTVLSLVVDTLASGMFVRRYGGSQSSFWAALAGALAGPFLIGPIGVLVGPFLAVLVVELVRDVDVRKALKVAAASVVGFLGGSFFRGVIHLVMIAWFFVQI